MKPERELIEHFNNRFAALKKARQSYESVWQDIIDHCAPDLDGYINKRQSEQAGERTDAMINDGDPADSALKCAAGLYASIASPSRPWFTEEMDDLTMDSSNAARTWLDADTELKYKIMHASNFYESIYTCFLHQTAIGTSAMLILPNYENVIHCTTLNIGAYWLGINAIGKVDTLYREFELTIAQLVEQFGDKVPEKLREKAKGKDAGERMPVIHAIEPNYHGMGDFPRKWVSVYYLADAHENSFLDINGFDIFPAACPRWFVNHGEIYGKMNPGRNALADMKQLQTMVLDYQEAVQKVNNPPTQGGVDSLVNGQLVLTPGAFNAHQSGTTQDTYVKPVFEIKPDLEAQWRNIEEKKKQIKTTFYVDMFMAITLRSDRDMTAEEVRALAGERMMGLSPGLENNNNELLNPIIDIISYYCTEAGITPEAPQEIAGMNYKPNYVSILAQAQKMTDVNRITQIVDFAVGVAERTGNPEVLDNIDLDAAIRAADKVIAAPSGIIRATNKVDEMRAKRAEQQQQQMMAENAMKAAEVAKTASGAKMDTPNALTAIMERMGGMQQ